MVSDNLQRAFGQLQEIQKGLLNGSLNPEALRKPLQAIIEHELPGLRPPNWNDLFVSPSQQLENIREWNELYQWGFTAAEFTQLPQAPETPRGLFEVAVLVPYLEGPLYEAAEPQNEAYIKAAEFDARVRCTFEALLRIIFQGTNFTRAQELNKSRRFEVVSEAEYPSKCLRWEVIDLAAIWDRHHGIRPLDVRSADSPHAGVLAAAAHFPKWVQAMDGHHVPYVWLPGYQALAHTGQYQNVLYLYWDRAKSLIQIGVEMEDRAIPGFAIPVLRGVQEAA